MTTTAIVGAGCTEFSKAAGRSELRLATEAILAAVGDAGMRVGDVDGLVSYTIDPVEETELARSLDLGVISWSSRVPYGGSGSQGMLQHAAAAVASGMAEVVVCYRACRSRSGRRFGRAELPDTTASTNHAGTNHAGTNHAGTTAKQWAAPFGVLTPASWFALGAVRYMHAHGVTSEDFGRAVVILRQYAATNPRAHFAGRPVTLDDHQSSRWIAEPAIRLFDCCQETDGAVAFVVTSAARSRDTPAPVQIAAVASAGVAGEEVASDHYSADITALDASAAVARSLFGPGGVDRSDIDVAMIYDAFTPTLFMQLEGLGFCPRGAAKDFVASGAIGPGGTLPCNTSGGLIGEGYIHGANLTLAAVEQLRGTAANQIDGARTALVSAMRTAVVLRTS